MALNPHRTNAVVNTLLDTMTALLNTGYLRIYDGTQPATADTAISSQVLLAELRWNATAFGASSAGVATANAITADSSANATGTASWFRALKSDGTTVVFDGTVGLSGTDCIINTTAIVSGATVSVSAATLTESK
jgi:hypothetical protein